jgi:hypothetical protein
MTMSRVKTYAAALGAALMLAAGTPPALAGEECSESPETGAVCPYEDDVGTCELKARKDVAECYETADGASSARPSSRSAS